MKRSGFGLLAGIISLFFFSSASQAVDQPIIIPAGSNLHVQLTVTASTKTNQSGDPWTGKVIEPIIAQGQEVVPAGSMAEGRITFVKPPGRAKGVGEMRLVLDKITTSDGLQYAVAAGLEDIQGAGDAKVKGEEGTIKGAGKSKKGTAVETGVGAGVGAAAGGIAAGGSGAEYGAIIGAAGGLLHSMLKHHKEIIIPQGTELTFVISRNIPGKKVPDSPDSSNPK